MTPEEKELMNSLCQRIAVEKDPKTFDELVHQLNELLEKKEYDSSLSNGRIRASLPGLRWLEMMVGNIVNTLIMGSMSANARGCSKTPFSSKQRNFGG
jgi:hypothetical protein